jgi:hypothetical protein
VRLAQFARFRGGQVAEFCSIIDTLGAAKSGAGPPADRFHAARTGAGRLIFDRGRAMLPIMRLLCAVLILASQCTGALADCTCRSQGRDYELGQSVCLQSPKGARIATCGMVLNNTSWQFSETPCVVSAAPEPARTPTHLHHAHGGQATLADVRHAAP